jgi:esterase/lipase superfamily enzyme
MAVRPRHRKRKADAMPVTVYFATNRQPVLDAAGNIAGFGADPGPIDGYAVRFGKAEVTVDLAAATNTMVPGSLYVAPEILTPPPQVAPTFGSHTIFDQVRRDMKNHARPTIVFIHGFANTFQASIERGGWNAAFLAAGGFDANMFVFSWPSGGDLVVGEPLPYAAYEHDRGTAASAGPAIARTMRILHDFVDGLDPSDRCQQELHLLCHSMGVYALRNGLQAWLSLPARVSPRTSATQSSIRRLSSIAAPGAVPTDVRRTFDRIVLAAGDEDDDTFDDVAKMELLPRLGNAVTVYHNRKDWVLNTLSSVTKFNGPRLGTNGPDNMGTISDKVTAVDVTDIDDFGQDPEGHQYYRIFPEIRDDLVGVFSGKLPTQFPKRQFLAQGRWLLTK